MPCLRLPDLHVASGGPDCISRCRFLGGRAKSSKGRRVRAKKNASRGERAGPSVRARRASPGATAIAPRAIAIAIGMGRVFPSSDRSPSRMGSTLPEDALRCRRGWSPSSPRATAIPPGMEAVPSQGKQSSRRDGARWLPGWNAIAPSRGYDRFGMGRDRSRDGMRSLPGWNAIAPGMECDRSGDGMRSLHARGAIAPGIESDRSLDKMRSCPGWRTISRRAIEVTPTSDRDCTWDEVHPILGARAIAPRRGGLASAWRSDRTESDGGRPRGRSPPIRWVASCARRPTTDRVRGEPRR